jgi:hypothetical protein
VQREFVLVEDDYVAVPSPNDIEIQVDRGDTPTVGRPCCCGRDIQVDLATSSFVRDDIGVEPCDPGLGGRYEQDAWEIKHNDEQEGVASSANANGGKGWSGVVAVDDFQWEGGHGAKCWR